MVSLRGNKVYLDAITVIYALEGLKFSNLRTGLLLPLDAGAFTAVASELTIVETVVGARKAGDLQTEAKYRAFLSPSLKLSLEPVSMAVLERAINLRVKHGFKIPDAIHIATGIMSGCNLFVTGDQAWSRPGVTVVDTSDVA